MIISSIYFLVCALLMEYSVNLSAYRKLATEMLSRIRSRSSTPVTETAHISVVRDPVQQFKMDTLSSFQKFIILLCTPFAMFLLFSTIFLPFAHVVKPRSVRYPQGGSFHAMTCLNPEWLNSQQNISSTNFDSRYFQDGGCSIQY